MPMKHLQSVTINHIFAATHVCAEITPVFSGPGVRLDIQGVSPNESPRKLWGHNSDTNMAIYTHISDICSHSVLDDKCP